MMARTSRRRRSSRKGPKVDKALAREFKRVVNMTPSQILRWRRDPRSREASYPKTRAELTLLAKMKQQAPSKWTPKMWDKAKRTVAFIRRHEGQMRVQARRFGSGRGLHYTRKRVIALLNWGRISPGVSVEGL